MGITSISDSKNKVGIADEKSECEENLILENCLGIICK